MNARGLSYCSYFPNYFDFRPVCCVRPLWPAAPRSQPSLNDLDPNFWIFISVSLGSSSCFYSFTSVAVLFTLSLRADVKKWETHHDKKLIWYVMIHFQDRRFAPLQKWLKLPFLCVDVWAPGVKESLIRYGCRVGTKAVRYSFNITLKVWFSNGL